MDQKTLSNPLENDTRRPDMAASLARSVIGQPAAIDAIVPYVRMFEVGLNPESRPAGVFLLLGPTGTGKTKTVEALAHELHGSEKCMLKIDCGEFQLDHEVAKLIGAPPGYLGHRETHPMISQQKLEASTSEHSKLSIVLFDEIEKAAPSLGRLLLGALDRATLHLGDNTVVDFENSLIFLTSNLGAKEMDRELGVRFGFAAGAPAKASAIDSKLQRIALTATRKHFSPEFINRIDSVITYNPLSRDAVSGILTLEIEELQGHVLRRLGGEAFYLRVSDKARDFLVERGTSSEFGARELKRTIHRHLTQPLAAEVADGNIPAASTVWIEFDERKGRLVIEPPGHRRKGPARSASRGHARMAAETSSADADLSWPLSA